MAENPYERDRSYSSSSSIGMSPGLPLFKENGVDHEKNRYPHCIVWTPIPMLTWLFPFIGHMGIATTQGVIRDFAGPYFVSEDCMAFGNPTKYWQLPLDKVPSRNNKDVWDKGVHEASEIYKERMAGGLKLDYKFVLPSILAKVDSLYTVLLEFRQDDLLARIRTDRVHNLCCDNCHSHVARALNLMKYDNSSSWNMVKLCFLMMIYSKFVSVGGFLKTWLPFLILLIVILSVCLALYV